MGKSYEHLKQHVPGVSHHIQSNGAGVGAPMPEAKQAKDVPHQEKGDPASRGSRNTAPGGMANICPSMVNGGTME